MEVKKEWLEWLASNDTGISSKTMLEAITGVPTGRCVRMLRKLPESY